MRYFQSMKYLKILTSSAFYMGSIYNLIVLGWTPGTTLGLIAGLGFFVQTLWAESP
jgi:hypothetical protein